MSAEELKNQGNKAFSAKDYDTAIELFSKAIELDPTNFVLWSNRSAAKAGKRQYGPALEDADQVRRLSHVARSAAERLSRSVSKPILHGPRVMPVRVPLCMVSGNTMKPSRRTRRVSSWRTAQR